LSKSSIGNLEKEYIQKLLDFRYKIYEENTTSFTKISPCSLDELYKKYILDLYDIKTVRLDGLRASIFESNPKKCLYCGIDKASEIDHYLPKIIYPSFSINHLNLIPICTTCNKSKSNRIFDSGDNSRLFLNMYFDKINNFELVRCNLIINDQNLLPCSQFIINNNLPENILKVAINHITKLSLISKFNSASSEKLSEFIVGYKNNPTSNINIQKSLENHINVKLELGINYWEYILYKQMNTEKFIDFVVNYSNMRSV
jgi:hypothetical protein